MIKTLTFVKAHLSELLNRVESGEEIFIKRNGKTVAKLVSFQQNSITRKPGAWKGKVKMADDFDELPKEILKGFLGESP